MTIKSTILARRARFIAAAIAGAGLTIGCSSSETCLSMAGPYDSGTEGGGDGESDADASPHPCLSPAADASIDAEAGPQVCLSQPPPDASDDADTGPQVCLAPPPADAASD